MMLVPIRKRYLYESMQRIDDEKGRLYVVEGGSKLPSVTHILSSTKDSKPLKTWAERVGEEAADKIKNDSATIGTHMHSVVERMLLNRALPSPRTWLAVQGYRMGYLLIEKFFPSVDEVWGSEVPLYYPEKYAGTSDCACVYKGAPSIVDFKQANKMKQRAWVEDYFLQLAAYALAHDKIHGTAIDQGVIMMVDHAGATQEFITCGREFTEYKDKWMRRVDTYLSR